MKHLLLAVATAVALAHASPALAQKEPPPDEIASKRLGVGYKIGNGLGFVGADVIVTLVGHVTLDLQANWFSVASEGSSASGYGVAPSLQLHLFKGQVSSPYLGLGYIYASASLDGVTASASGAFANAGYEWRWASGLGILLGGGVAYLGSVHATNGVETVDAPGGTHFNLEVGLRYMFL